MKKTSIIKKILGVAIISLVVLVIANYTSTIIGTPDKMFSGIYNPIDLTDYDGDINIDGQVLSNGMGLYNPVAENMQNPKETVIEDMADASSSEAVWDKGTAGTQTGDTDSFIKGDRSLKLTTSGDGVRVQSRREDISPTLNVEDKVIKVWVKINNSAVIESNGCRIWFSSDNFGSDYFYFEMVETSQGDPYVRDDTWTSLTFSLNSKDVNVSGTPDYTAINSIQFTIEDDGTGVMDAWLGGISTFSQAKEPIISFVFDDGPITQYTEGKKYLSKFGYPATAYIISDYVDSGNSNYMSLAQLKELQNLHGWDIAGHSSTFLTSISAEEVETELLTVKNWLLKNGFSKGSEHFALPGGTWDEDNVMPMIRKYFSSSRTVFNGSNETLPPNDQHKLRPIYINDSTATSTVFERIDQIIADNGWGILTFHKIVPLEDVALSTEYSIIGFQQIVDYVYSKGVKVKTISDVINSNNPNYIEMVDNEVDINGGIKSGSYTADPCGSLTEGMTFYNDTSDYYCFCDGAGVDKKISDNGACF